MRWRRNSVQTPRSWPPPGGPYRDERLAFLAVAPYLSRRGMRAGQLRTLLADLFSPFYAYSVGDGHKATRRGNRHVVFACEEAAAKLDALERQRLRQHGELPTWFVVEVERLARKP